MTWKDVTSYSRNEPEPRVSCSFELNAGGLSIVVTRHIHCAADEWILRCAPWFDLHVIGNGTADAAKGAAVMAVRAKLQSALNALGGQ